jgi:acyl-coenzyme A synthetase/AMP-(fatty) acid ligase
MYILTENEVKKDIGVLDKAWENPETFLFLSEKSGVSNEWVRQCMRQLPETVNRGHFILLTSGSTGRPKLVVGLRERAEKLAKTLHIVQESESVNETVALLPLTYCYAFINQWLWAYINEREFINTDGLGKPDHVYSTLQKVRNCMICAVGPLVPLFEHYYWKDVSFPGIIRLHFAGSMFPQTKLNFLHRLFPSAKIFNNYGCAEAMPRLTIRSTAESNEASNIGKPIPGVRMQTSDTGEILFRSEYQAVALFDEKGLFMPGDEDWIPTGDFGEILDDGYWRIRGRTNEVFKRYGEKISLSQMLESVNEVWSGNAVFYRESDPSGEAGHVLVLSPEITKEQVNVILQMFRKRYNRIHWPLRLESIDSIPLLNNGKIDFRALALMANKIIHWRQRL